MSTTVEDLEGWVDDMMRKRDIYKYKMDLAGSTEKGDGYLGEVNFIKVVADLKDGKEKTYNLVVKSAKKSDEFRKQTPIQEAYYREMFIYTKVFPLFEEFQKELAIEDTFDKYAKCYSTCHENKKEALIFMNLKFRGFELHDRTVPQNLNHALYVFKNYGKFHGVSIALGVKKPGLYRSLIKNMDDLLAAFVNKTNMIDTFLTDFRKGVDILRKTGREHLAKKYDNMEDDIRHILTNPKLPQQSHRVILHGDCWNNNMMFKYEDSNKTQPVDMCFIDYQISRVSSPLYDLSYYLYTCCDKTVLQNFDFLLQSYHSSLSDYLDQYGISCDNVITYKQLKEQWKYFGKFGLAMSPFLLKMMLAQTDEVVDFAEAAEKGMVSTAFDITITNTEAYDWRVGDVFSHFAEKFL